MEQSGRRPGGEPTRRGGKPTPRTCSVAAVDARRLLPASIVLGVANAGLFLGFEYLVNHGTEWLWDDRPSSASVSPFRRTTSCLSTAATRTVVAPSPNAMA